MCNELIKNIQTLSHCSLWLPTEAKLKDCVTLRLSSWTSVNFVTIQWNLMELLRLQNLVYCNEGVFVCCTLWCCESFGFKLFSSLRPFYGYFLWSISWHFPPSPESSAIACSLACTTTSGRRKKKKKKKKKKLGGECSSKCDCWQGEKVTLFCCPENQNYTRNKQEINKACAEDVCGLGSDAVS